MRPSDLRFLLVLPFLLGAAPSRTQTYVAGQVISNTAVTENEDNIFAYLQAGVDTLRDNTVTAASILNGTIVNADISSSAAISLSKLEAGTSTQLIVVSAGGVPTYNTLSGDATISAGGVLTISSNAIGTAEVTDGTLTTSDLSSSAAITFAQLASLTNASFLVGNGSNVATAVAMSGDIALANTGATTVQDNSVDGTDIAIGGDVQGGTLYYNGTDWVQLGVGTSGQFLQTKGAAANPIWATSTLQSKVFTGSRADAAGTGTEAVSGAGFQPTALHVNLHQNNSADASQTYSIGFVDSSKGIEAMCVSQDNAGNTVTNRTSTFVTSDAAFGTGCAAGGSSSWDVTISSYDADGFTLSWTEGGSTGGNAEYEIIAYR